MSNSYKLQRIRDKYPEILTDNGLLIDLHKINSYLNLLNYGNFSYFDLLTLGLLDFKKDLTWILCDLKKDRRDKLEKLNNI